MTVRLNLCDGIGDIGPDGRAWLMPTLEATRDKCQAVLPLTDADVNIIVAPRMVIPEYGMCGYTLNRSVVQITLDPWSLHFKHAERESRVGGVFAHERHHLARFRSPACEWSPKYLFKRSLGHVLILEGLAQAFEEELGFPTPFYATAVSGERLWQLADRARAEFEAVNVDCDAWFFGRANDLEFPRLGGYCLGYALVKGWLAHADTKPSKEVDLKTGALLDAWRAGRIVVA